MRWSTSGKTKQGVTESEISGVGPAIFCFCSVGELSCDDECF